MVVCRWILLGMRIFRTKFAEKMKTHILCPVNPPPPRKSCRLWGSVEKYGRAGQATGDSIIRRMRSACWVTKATHTHSEFVIVSIAFLLQRWLHKRASVARHTYVACLVRFPPFLLHSTNASCSFIHPFVTLYNLSSYYYYYYYHHHHHHHEMSLHSSF